VIASVHLCDSSPWRNLIRSTAKPATVPGLRWSHKALCGQLSAGARPQVQPGRGGMVAWWDDDDALDRFLADDPKAAPLRGGWSVRLQPTRTRATWPNADFDPFPEDNVRHEGVHAAITLGTARVPRFPRFLKASSLLEEQFLGDEFGIWGLAVTLPPRIVMTLTFWESQDATDAYTRSGAHGEAMRQYYDFPTDKHEFVSDGGFFGFQPYALAGRLAGRNPTPARLSG
jgi:hypothetical protein